MDAARRVTGPGQDGTENDRRNDVGDASWFDGRLGIPATGARTVHGVRRQVMVVAAVLAVVAAAALAAHVSDRSSSTVGVASVPAGAVPAASSPSRAHAAVVALQTVPALTDVVVKVGERTYASGADGRIDLSDADPVGVVHVVGRVDGSPLVRVTFTGWADGRADTVRTLSELAGPVVQIGFSVAYQVQVAGATGTVALDSAVGTVEMTAGRPVTLIAAQARRDGAQLVVEVVSYTVRRPAGETTPSMPTWFTPTPGAVWTITG